MKKILLLCWAFGWLLIACNNNEHGVAKDGKTNTGKANSDDESLPEIITNLTGIKDIETLLCQNWEHKEDAADAAASGSGGDLEMPYRGLSFFDDGSITENPRDDIRMGTWKLDTASKTIDITFAKGQKLALKIGGIGPKSLLLLNMADKKKTEYIADGLAQQVATNDPFFGDNNKWRIKPAAAETDSAIKLRAEQCVLFFAKFMKDNAQRGGNSISFLGLPGCFKWYRGGVSVTTVAKLEEKWINCFYNKQQALKAHTMLENIISKKYKWDKKETNWVKQSADVVKQMHDTLKVTSIQRLLR